MPAGRSVGWSKVQLPMASAMVSPTLAPSTKSSTVTPASAVPVNVGVESRVTSACVGEVMESQELFQSYVDRGFLTLKPTVFDCGTGPRMLLKL